MKLIFFCLSLFTLVNLHQMEAKTVTLETGNWIFDRSRTIEIDQFDYIYTIQSIHLGGYFLELEDGSVWEVEELGPESKSFYRNNGVILNEEFVENIVAFWQRGEHLVFHKVIDRESLLVYNIERDQLFDFVPLSPPKYEALTITVIDYVNTIVALSDGSAWVFNNLCPCKKWMIGDPIHIAKDTPWDEHNTHILINLKYCECDATKGHIHPNRLGVKRVL